MLARWLKLGFVRLEPSFILRSVRANNSPNRVVLEQLGLFTPLKITKKTISCTNWHAFVLDQWEQPLYPLGWWKGLPSSHSPQTLSSEWYFTMYVCFCFACYLNISLFSNRLLSLLASFLRSFSFGMFLSKYYFLVASKY